MNEHLKGKHKTLGEESMTKKNKKFMESRASGVNITRVQLQFQQTKMIRYIKNKTTISLNKDRKMIELKSTELFHFLEM